MTQDELYKHVISLYNAKDFDAVAEFVDELEKTAPDSIITYLVKVEIYLRKGEWINAIRLFEKILPYLNTSSPNVKALTMRFLEIYGAVCAQLGVRDAKDIRALVVSASLVEDPATACKIMSEAIMAQNRLENFSQAAFQNLCAEYEKYLTDITPYPRKFYDHEKIRVGFISADFCLHVVMIWSLSLILGLNRNNFKVYCYSAKNADKDIQKFISTNVAGWRDISKLDDEQAAQMIRDDEIDILFDLSGHTASNRLRVAAYRPASVQVSGIGYMNSTGLKCFDYFLSDIYCAGDDKYFSEKVIRLPHSHICYKPFHNPPIEPAQREFVTFGCFNLYSKITDLVLTAWQKILEAVPGSRLILKHIIYGKEGGKEFVGKRLEKFGIDLSRVEMRPFTQNSMRDYNDVDIALDTFPYTGGVTTCDALYMGVPVVSLYGLRQGTRFGLSILNNVGLGEFAVNSLDKYIKWAVALAADGELRAFLKKNLRSIMMKSPLMNPKIYLPEIEAAFKKILAEERTLHGEENLHDGGAELLPAE